MQVRPDALRLRVKRFAACRSSSNRLHSPRLELRELLADDHQPIRRARLAGVDREERCERLQFLARGAVVERPASVHAQLRLRVALRDERRDDDEAAVAEAQLVIVPCARGGVDRLLAETLAHALRKPRLYLLSRYVELAGVCVEPTLVAVVVRDISLLYLSLLITDISIKYIQLE